MVGVGYIESATNCHLNNANRIGEARPIFAPNGLWKKETGQKGANASRGNVQPFPPTSRYFPAVPHCFEVWETRHTFEGRNVRWRAKQEKELQTNNRTMGYFIITDSNWARLRNEILNLAETCHKAFGEQSRHTDWLHNGDVCKLLNISKRTLQHYRDTGVLPFAQIGHKCYYKR